MDRQLEACLAAERIINVVQSAGFDLSDPRSIIQYSWSDLPDGIQYAYGASRLVLWDEYYCDYVVKIALDPGYEKYCQREVEVYAAAVQEGLADSFGWCMCYSEPIEEVDNYVPGIYVMEYLDCNEDEVYDDAWCYGYKEYCRSNGLDASNYDNADEYNDWNCEDEGMYLDYFESEMGRDYLRAFEVFLCKWRITDLHQGNFSTGHPSEMKIVDYAGWGW